MAQKVLISTVGGKSGGVTYVDCGADELAVLASLMEGKVEQYDVKSSGGTFAPMPAMMRRMKVSVRKQGSNYRETFTIPHVKASKNDAEVRNAIKGVFDAAFTTDLKCDYVSSFSNMVKGA